MRFDRRKILNAVLVSPALFLTRKAKAFSFFGSDDGDDFGDLDGEVAYDPEVEGPLPGNPAPAAPAPATPEIDSFGAKMKQMRDQLERREYSRTLADLERLGEQPKKALEAKRLFYMARAEAGRKKYVRAISLNEKALTLKPNQVSSRFNNGCYSCRAKDNKAAMKHMTRMVDYLVGKKSNQTKRFLKMMREDEDLVPIRSTPEFAKLVRKMETV